MEDEFKKEICSQTGKICYTQKAASEAINKVKRAKRCKKPKVIPQRSYHCKFCGMWHLTHFRRLETCKVSLHKYGYRGFNRNGIEY